jgi:hypothetical protein
MRPQPQRVAEKGHRPTVAPDALRGVAAGHWQRPHAPPNGKGRAQAGLRDLNRRPRPAQGAWTPPTPRLRPSPAPRPAPAPSTAPSVPEATGRHALSTSAADAGPGCYPKPSRRRRGLAGESPEPAGAGTDGARARAGEIGIGSRRSEARQCPERTSGTTSTALWRRDAGTADHRGHPLCRARRSGPEATPSTSPPPAVPRLAQATSDLDRPPMTSPYLDTSRGGHH